MHIPATADELTTDWFGAALERSDLERIEVVERMHGTCSKLRVHLYTAAPAPQRLLVKGGFEDHSHLFWPMHRTEARWYRDIAARSPIVTPQCHFAGIDPENGRALVILEDLDAAGAKWHSALHAFDWDRIAGFVDSLARLAACWWQSPELAPGGGLDWVVTSYEGEAADYIARYLDPDTWLRFMDLPRCAGLPRSLKQRERIAEALEALAARMANQALTLSHGDVHPGNLYSTARGEPGFVDAQPRLAPWVKDFAYLVVSALDPEDRRNWERRLLERYLETLARSGVAAVPSFEAAWEDYRREVIYGLFIFMINESHFQREAINTACAARFGAAAIDHGTLGLLGCA